MNEVVPFSWADGTELVRFLDNRDEVAWTIRVEQQVNDQIKGTKDAKRNPFEWRVDERRLFLLEPAAGGRRCIAAFGVMVERGELFMIDRVLPYFQFGATPDVTRKTWGLWKTLRMVPSIAERGGLGPRGEGVFVGLDLPWLQGLVEKRGHDVWPVTMWFDQKIRYDACDDYRNGTFGVEVNGATRIRGRQKPPKTIRIRKERFWEVSRRPRPHSTLPGPSEFVWSASNHELDLHVTDETDLEAALVKTGIVFWRQSGVYGRDAFVDRHADLPIVGQDEEVNLLLGQVPPSLLLPTKELRAYVEGGL